MELLRSLLLLRTYIPYSNPRFPQHNHHSTRLSTHSRGSVPILPQLSLSPWRVPHSTSTSKASLSSISPSFPSSLAPRPPVSLGQTNTHCRSSVELANKMVPVVPGCAWCRPATASSSPLSTKCYPRDGGLLLRGAPTSSSRMLSLGSLPRESPPGLDSPFIPKHEASYAKILDRLFDDRLDIVNSPSLVSSEGHAATLPEYALGRLRKQLSQREELVPRVENLLQDYDTPADLHKPSSRWLASRDD